MTDALDEVRAQWRQLRPELDTAPIDTVGRINRISRILQLQSDALLKQFGFSRGEFDILAALVRSDRALMPSEIADRLIVSAPAVTKWTQRLVEQGHIERRPHPRDKRGSLLYATRSGADAIHAMLPVQLEAEAQPLGIMSPTELDALNATLRTLLAQLEPQHASHEPANTQS
ncbi:MarR family winged helix-turn-helix transcriptional regulator [Lysinibacter cavernae]|uniref:DNA-binding MarR family transcriptional regulator n=1 Tax=Lysinibacter cavernae TaxID=1640652 RepID=A0A7X5R2H2_9MICO|nr:MarR family transcriptional regulator [Lysinibacter cavernae]NIH54449.1 DNA-binding MarR family transcriptional regulator [Lysinibacter cavernae]